MLIDGLRVGSSSVGATSLEAIPLDQIERIEILRGPASSLYGADAIGGVIQVFTRQARGGRLQRQRAARDTAPTTTPQCQRRPARLHRAALRFSVQAGGTRSAGFNAIVNPGNFGYNPDRDGYSHAERRASTRCCRGAAGQEVAVQYLRQPPQQPVRRRCPVSTTAPSPRSKSWSVVEPQPARRAAGARLLTARLGQRRLGVASRPSATRRSRPRSASTSGRTTSRCRSGALSLMPRAARGASGHATTTSRSPTATPTPSPACTRCATTRWRCRATCATTTPASTAARRPAASPSAISFSPAWRVTAGYSTGFKAPSFNDLYYPGLLQSGPRARDGAQRRGRRVLDRDRRRRPLGSASRRLSQPRRTT